MKQTFTKKRIDATISLGSGSFNGTDSNAVTLSGLRMTADMIHSTGDFMGKLQLRVFGLPQAMMNQLTVIGKINRINPLNTISIAAGDDVNGLSVVFQGIIFEAWADYNSAPDVALNVIAIIGLDALMKPVNAISFRGSTDVAEIMAGLAKTMGLAFQNDGVNVKLASPYFDKTALVQVRACAKAADIWYSIDMGTLSIWPKNGSRPGPTPLISAETGMVGYPSLSSSGMNLKTMFNPEIRIGCDVEVKSEIPMACGIFRTGPFTHSLSCELPGGPWFTTLECYRVDN